MSLLMAGGIAQAAEREQLRGLTAPEPAVLTPIPASEKPQPVRLSRAAVQLSPGPWARVDVAEPSGMVHTDYVTWADEGHIDIAPLAAVFAEEMKAAGVPVQGGATSLFEEETMADLQLGVRIIDLKGRMCRGCGLLTPGLNWVGAVTMDARWEVYSQLQGKVLMAVETRGGFATPKRGLAGEPIRLVEEAFRDNVRRLVASEVFRKTLTGSNIATAQTLTPIAYRPVAPAKRPIASSADAVVAVFAGDGHGTGFLISADGYLLTNHHVVAGSKYVKVRWPDRSESLGEVVRSDRRRDVALIKADASGRQPLALRSSGASLGEAVFAVGTPLDQKFQGTVTKGIVSASRTYDGLGFIQSDVTVNSGNSGGPLLDENGAVIGVTVSGYQINGAPAGLNLFIPIAEAVDVLALEPAS